MAIQEERNLNENSQDKEQKLRFILPGMYDLSKKKGEPFCKSYRIPGYHISNCKRRTIFNTILQELRVKSIQDREISKVRPSMEFE